LPSKVPKPCLDYSTFTDLAPGDQSTILEAKRHARESFNHYAHSRYSGTTEAEQGIEHAKGVAQILRENVVQGAKDKEDTTAPYSMCVV